MTNYNTTLPRPPRKGKWQEYNPEPDTKMKQPRHSFESPYWFTFFLPAGVIIGVLIYEVLIK